MDRTKYIGGADAGAVLGLSPWKTPYAVWLEKTKRVPPLDHETPEMLRGKDLESLVARKYTETEDLKLNRPRRVVKHDKFEFIAGHPDRISSDGSRIVEIKTTFQFDYLWGEPETDAVPAHYAAQCAHYAALTNIHRVDIAALAVRDWEFRIYRLEFKREFLYDYLERIVEWWKKHVEKDTPPAFSSRDASLIRAIAGEIATATPEVIADLAELRRLDREIAELEKKREDCAAKIKLFMGSAETLIHNGEVVATWRETKRSSFDIKALRAEAPEVAQRFTRETVYRRFLVKNTSNVE